MYCVHVHYMYCVHVHYLHSYVHIQYTTNNKLSCELLDVQQLTKRIVRSYITATCISH